MVIVGRAQAPPPWETPPTAKIPPLHPLADPPPPQTTPCPPPPRVLTDSWGWVASGPVVVAPPWYPGHLRPYCDGSSMEPLGRGH